MNIVWRLLRRNISAGQIVGYAVANLVGLAIVLTAIQFYRDINNVWEAEDSFMTSDYLVITKSVSMLNSIGSGEETSFNQDEINDIKAQPWAKKVGTFTAADYNVYASLDLGGRSMSTYLFFESIPDEFFDISPRDWSFDPENPVIPIVMSKDYLTLYNFGFAASRGLPQLSESLIGRVPLTIGLAGNDQAEKFTGRIVGFSSRLNTIAVPQQFMDWANQRYGTGETAAPSRVIIEVSKPGDPVVTDYLDAHGYEPAGDKVNNGKASYFLNVVTGIVIAVGAIISLLAFFILLLSIYLLLQKNRRTLHDLMLLGYTPWNVAKYYYIMVSSVNVLVLIVGVVTMVIGSTYWNGQLEQLGVTGSSHIPTIIVGIVIMAAITVGNIIAIRLTVKSYFHDN
jgi:hypothetical protein